jgi:hypothetical protein
LNVAAQLRTVATARWFLGNHCAFAEIGQ